MAVRLILDVDTGVDDALALALAVRHPAAQLEAVLTVAGNVGLPLVTRNTLRVLDWLGASTVPVYAGAERPLEGAPRDASYWHSADGLGGARLPGSTRSAAGEGVTELIERLICEPGQLSVVCTAPLTNLALAVQREPSIVQAVQQVVLMGGAARPPGNITPVAEFNIYADPHAAAIVFAQDWEVVMVGLDVTHHVTLSRADRAALAGLSSPEAVLLREVSRDLFEGRGVERMALHDPLAVLIALQPDLAGMLQADVAVETSGAHTLGQTVVDLRPQAPPPARHTRVCTQINTARARMLFFETLGLPLPS